ncbi:MAG: hypothetical protein A3C11_00680 [Candidatus Sungbacteria bacterium RIFCSPHIGHO2_02_FULL_49_12]|uniref:Uncharacterized protein n=1 Tax=Candidatus Sungbacteria bacterium RIFCSPHIGHO2_02_FULL_49_12 TaxID=1802271 RepID=A0A1G2KLG0_9BACT|nr:MAG: hypothetical protein A3C11_00680 [Candidatus Sungbacteria bacterium RIFCSPHIGHO2_02_FULL_49_12]
METDPKTENLEVREELLRMAEALGPVVSTYREFERNKEEFARNMDPEAFKALKDAFESEPIVRINKALDVAEKSSWNSQEAK